MFRKSFLFLLTGLLFVVGLSLENTNAESVDDIDSVHAEFLSNLEEGIENEQGERKVDLEQFYKEYTALEVAEQKQFLEYVTDEELMKEVIFESGDGLNTTQNESVSRTLDQNNSEIPDGFEVEERLSDDTGSGEVIESDVVEPFSNVRRATYEKTVGLFGIDFMVHRSELRYYGGNGSNITGIEGYNHYMARNFTVNSTNYSGAYSNYSSTLAYTGATMQISLISEYIPIVGPYISGDVYVEVDNNRNVYGYAIAN